MIRALMDTYFAMYYVAVERISDEERDCRETSWRFHGEADRLFMLKLIRSGSPELPSLEVAVDALREQVVNLPSYRRLDAEIQKKIRKGERPLHLSNSELATRAGISTDYYRAVYRYLSSYTHTYPYSVTQLAHLRGGDPESLHLFSTALQYCLAFLAVAVRDFWSLFPDLEVSCDAPAQMVLDTWISHGANFNRQ